MDINKLRSVLELKLKKLPPEVVKDMTSELESLRSVFPFSDIELGFAYLLSHCAISLEEYCEIRGEYIRANHNLHLFGLAPRTFGQIWGESHLCEIDNRFVIASKALDANFDGEYDLLVDSVRIEVKACRAINTKRRASIESKALSSKSGMPFWMNFQQLKFDICDVFVFIGVWVDEIKYWVLSHDEVKNNSYLSSQHRGGIEYQIGIKDSNISEFDGYLVDPDDLVTRVIEKAG